MRSELRFGIVSAAPSADRQLRVVCDELSKVLGEKIEGRVLPTFPQLAAAIEKRDIDVAWTPPLTAVELERAGTIEIALGVWRGSGPSYSSAIFVPERSAITRLEHLRGKRMAWVDPSSAAGYVFPRLKLVSLGLQPDALFSSQVFYRTHEDVVRAVFEGRADVGATCVAFYGSGEIQSAGWSKARAHKDSEVRILETAGPIPTDAIVVATRIPAARRKRIADGLLKISVSVAARDSVASLFSGQGFVSLGSSQYEPVRALLGAARRAG